MLEVSVSNFGPIIEGSVRLRPLTVFVGPNNAGKSYLAMLIYGLLQSTRSASLDGSLLGALIGSILHHDPMLPKHVLKYRTLLGALIESGEIQQHRDELKLWLDALWQNSDQETPLRISELSDRLRYLVTDSLRQSVDEYIHAFERELQRSFGGRLAELIRLAGQAGPMRFAIKTADPSWELALVSTDNSFTKELPDAKFFEEVAELPVRLGVPTSIASIARSWAKADPEIALFGLIFSAITSLYRDINRTAFYLPASRGGLVQAYKAIASYSMGQMAYGSFEDPRLPSLPGVVTDFARILISVNREVEGRLSEVGRFIETDVAQGSVSVQAEGHIFYEFERVKIPIHLTSSMVSELAPIILLLKHVVAPGDFLIIEEPESHLHPAAQRKVARAIAMLVRAGVRVLITTHSDYLVTQLSNLIKLGELSPERRVELGYGENVFLKPEDLGAYLFEQTAEGSRIVELTVNAEDGIPEGTFSTVVSSLYEETVNLETATSR